MSEKLSAPLRRWQGKYVLLAVFCVLVISVLVIGINNIPGIILGYLATTILVFTLTHTRRKMKRFLILFIASLAGIFVLSFLHEEVLYPLAIMIGGVNALQSDTLFVFHVVISLIIAFVCPVGILVGTVGSVVLYLGKRRAIVLNST